MVVHSLLDAGGAGPGGSFPLPASMFMLEGSPSFQPFYVPERRPVSKERNLNRKENWCGGEDVNDWGAKNREIHVSGLLLDSELDTFNAVLDSGETFDLVMPAWSGEVNVLAGELDGPVAVDARKKEYLYQYTLDLVSTGRDEVVSTTADGIISSGADGVPETPAGAGFTAGDGI
jgi:hypothetical protein